MLRRSSTKNAKPAKAPRENKVKPPREKKAKSPSVKAVKSSVVKIKKRTDIYTLMLLFAFLAALTACIFLYLDLAAYGTNRKPSGFHLAGQDIHRGLTL